MSYELGVILSSSFTFAMTGKYKKKSIKQPAIECKFEHDSSKQSGKNNSLILEILN
jgi:hypothetical protein